MKLQNLSVKRLFGRVAMGLVLSLSGITIALFLVTKQTAVLLTSGPLTDDGKLPQDTSAWLKLAD